MSQEKQNLNAISLAIAACVVKIHHGEVRIVVRDGQVVDIFPTKHYKPHELLEENADILLTEKAKTDNI